MQGGVGEKLLNQMGWKNGEGLGKTKVDLSCIQFLVDDSNAQCTGGHLRADQIH